MNWYCLFFGHSYGAKQVDEYGNVYKVCKRCGKKLYYEKAV